MSHNLFPFTSIMKRKTNTPHKSRMCPMDFGVKRSKVKVTIHWLLNTINVAYLLPLYIYHHETSHKESPWLEGVPYGCRGPKVKVTMQDYWKWFLLHSCFPFTPIIMKLHTKNPLERRVCRIGVWFKRSKVKVTMHWLLKMFLAHNCFSFTSTIIKLLAHIPYESRICLYDIGVKNLGSLIWIGCCVGYLSR